MEFGKLPDISGIDLSLPPDHGGIGKVLGGARAPQPRVYVGAPVWADEGFPGKIYPSKARGKDFVRHYGKQFNSIELNATHYRVPDPDTIRKWASEVPEGFRFCPKIHQSISHAGSLTHMIPHMKDLMLSLHLFGNRLGMPFLQLPPQFHTGRLDELLTFLDEILIKELAIELRHESWFVEEAPMKLLCNYLYKNNLCLNITDVAGRRDVLHQRLTCKKAFIRFVANDLHPTDFERMQQWAQRLHSWMGMGLEEVYFFVHTPTKSLTPELAIYFIREFNRLTGLKLIPPKIMEQSSEPQTLF